jgi:hypothetical protein
MQWHGLQAVCVSHGLKALPLQWLPNGWCDLARLDARKDLQHRRHQGRKRFKSIGLGVQDDHGD